MIIPSVVEVSVTSQLTCLRRHTCTGTHLQTHARREVFLLRLSLEFAGGHAHFRGTTDQRERHTQETGDNLSGGFTASASR